MYLGNTDEGPRSGGYPTSIHNFAKAAFESLLNTVILLMNNAIERTEYTTSTWGLE